MSSFPENVFQAFRSLTIEHRFVPVKVGASKRFASLARQETKNVYSYLFASDGRMSGGNLDIDLWIAPPDEPGDGLDRLYVGHKIRIASEFEVDDGYFAKSQQRVIHLLPFVSAIVPLVDQELEEPSFQTKRWSVYRIQRKAIFSVLTEAANGNNRIRAAVNEARRLADEKGSMERLKEVCLPIAESLLESTILDDEVFQFFKGKTDSFASSISMHLYVYALGEKSVASIL
ncbi:Imm25 family immunity protein [Singulisphaera rosea]